MGQQPTWCATDDSPVYESVDPNGPPAMAALKNLAWPVGARLTVRFLDGANSLNESIISIAKEWEQYANLTFNFLPIGDSTTVKSTDIRIAIRDNDTAKTKGSWPGHWSMLGTNRTYTVNNKDVVLPLTMPTMNFNPVSLKQYGMSRGQYGYGTVLHEFGHAIGLVHEHLRPDRPIKFADNKELYTYYLSNWNWDQTQVDSNIIKTQDGLVGTSNFDFKSIMLYWFPNKVLSENDPKLKNVGKADALAYPSNNILSVGDIGWIGLLYPKKGARGDLTPVIKSKL